MVSDEWMLDLEVGRWSEVHSTIIIFAYVTLCLQHFLANVMCMWPLKLCICSAMYNGSESHIV
jgi:hypothetical protein